MGLGYLLDSNAVIDLMNQRLPVNAKYLLFDSKPIISIVTRIEIFAKPVLAVEEQLKLETFLALCEIYQISEAVALETIRVRQKHKLKFPDAVIAATALVSGLTLITNNFSDFKKVEKLILINPYTL